MEFIAAVIVLLGLYCSVRPIPQIGIKNRKIGLLVFAVGAVVFSLLDGRKEAAQFASAGGSKAEYGQYVSIESVVKRANPNYGTMNDYVSLRNAHPSMMLGKFTVSCESFFKNGQSAGTVTRDLKLDGLLPPGWRTMIQVTSADAIIKERSDVDADRAKCEVKEAAFAEAPGVAGVEIKGVATETVTLRNNTGKDIRGASVRCLLNKDDVVRSQLVSTNGRLYSNANTLRSGEEADFKIDLTGYYDKRHCYVESVR